MIDFAGVTKKYGSVMRPALDDVTVSIGAGEFAFLVGASGSGKSTMMRLILREERPTAGTIEVAGRDLVKIRRRQVPRLRRDIGMVFQDFRLLPDKTVDQNVAYVMHVLGAPRKTVRTAVAEALDLVGLAGMGRRLPHELSGGEQQRVAIARAVVKKPTLLLADEPTGNLDPTTSLGIVSLLDEINSAGTTVLMATHDDDIVNQLRKRVIELQEGKLVRDQDRGVYGGMR
ncbi:Cell division ATP-binding protein FtsE [Austwickia sp. TVS 96-490-7B]|uniref:cell division ATP-binding protein FtsE n=1 Tax=Austwickia sp. TVS 96-490-7B TaxID=2830843 RepID=UPI001C5A5AB7|nr:cell division ATP-binding protein FtsE [Austwickia sp. TVS 96-490-7B]MBW3086575.1 Cell division ATP-binding protein FtsE [Austwickia sp. TVS 96-490-7B]